ncbi:hypothetical protein, partial [Citrobacter youngae]|uniref:hypothetical protein n=1 Tax=Citrobacter youngae TaxID=133448 RepID=UPI00396B1B29
MTGRTEVDDRTRYSASYTGSRTYCLMRCAYQAYKIRSGRIRRCAASGNVHPAQTQKSPSVRMGFFTLIDA